MPDEQADLVRRSRGGDRQAFEELIRQTARLLFARACLETGDRQRSEDLVQETYLLAWKRIGQVKDPGAFRAWLLAILHRVIVDEQRSHSRKKRGSGLRLAGMEPDAIADARGDPREAAEAGDEQRKALAVLRGLPGEYRQALMLRYLAGADYEEIARQLAISNGSLRGLLNRGLAMMRRELTGTRT